MPKPKNEPVFVEPEFSEEQFLRYERDRAKTTIVAFLLAIGSGFLEGYLQIIGLYYLSVLLFIVLFIGLAKILGFLKLPLPVRNSHKFYLFMVFLLASILFWSMALNPPVSFNTSPVLSMEYDHNGTWTAINTSNGAYECTFHTSSFYLRNSIIYNKNVTLVHLTSSLTSSIITYNQTGSYVNMHMAAEGVGTILTLTTELESHGKYYNATQTLNFVS